MNAINIAARMGLKPNFLPQAILMGARAIVGQFCINEAGRWTDQSEKINGQRNKYTPKACFAKGNR